LSNVAGVPHTSQFTIFLITLWFWRNCNNSSLFLHIVQKAKFDHLHPWQSMVCMKMNE